MNFCVVGVGGIGIRHVESFLSFRDSRVFCVDSVRANQPLPANTVFTETVGSLPSNLRFDAVVISTSSKPRLNLLKQVCILRPKMIILEKVAFTSCHEYETAMELGRRYSIQIFVNYAWRYADSLLPILKTSKRWSIFSPGSGLCCNLCHFLDLYRYAFGFVPRNVSISRSGDVYESKRRGYFDFLGSADFSADEVKVAGRFDCNRGANGFRIETDTGYSIQGSDVLPLVSKTTARCFQEFIEGKIRLPNLEEDFMTFRTVRDEMARCGGWDNQSELPIT